MKISTEQKIKLANLGNNAMQQREQLIGIARELHLMQGTVGAQKSLARIISDLAAWRDKYAPQIQQRAEELENCNLSHKEAIAQAASEAA